MAYFRFLHIMCLLFLRCSSSMCVFVCVLSGSLYHECHGWAASVYNREWAAVWRHHMERGDKSSLHRTDMYTHTSIHRLNNDEYTGHTDYTYLLQKGWSYDTWFYLQMQKIIEEMAKEVWSMDNQLKRQNPGQSSMCAFHF